MFPTSLPHVHERVYSNSGNRFLKNYRPVYDENGHYELKEIESKDIYEYIQSFRESCDMKCIIDRYLSGDTEALNRRVPVYIDSASMPDNARDWLNFSIQAQEDFKKLPPEIRKNFNDSFEQYLMAIGSADFAEKLGVKNDEQRESSAGDGSTDGKDGSAGDGKDGSAGDGKDGDLLAVIKFSADKEADFFKALRKLGAELYKFERR